VNDSARGRYWGGVRPVFVSSQPNACCWNTRSRSGSAVGRSRSSQSSWKSGALVTKEELVARVWPDTFVEEGNLRVHMAALRRALGDGQAGNRYVVTVPGRGYRFVASVSVLEPSARRRRSRTRRRPAIYRFR